MQSVSKKGETVEKLIRIITKLRENGRDKWESKSERGRDDNTNNNHVTRIPSRPLKDVNTVAKELDSLTENHTAMLTSFKPYIFLDLILFSWFIVLFLGIFVLGFCYGILCNIFFL